MPQPSRSCVNPYYATRIHRVAIREHSVHPKKPEVAVSLRPTEASQRAWLPRIPRNASPVPHLTSLYHNPDRGDYGSAAYPGNCGGNLIKDLLRYFLLSAEQRHRSHDRQRYLSRGLRRARHLLLVE